MGVVFDDVDEGKGDDELRPFLGGSHSVHCADAISIFGQPAFNRSADFRCSPSSLRRRITIDTLIG